jgi:hypothetical protein
MTKITVAKGDGIGPEIMDATLNIILAAGAKIEIDEIEVGEKVEGADVEVRKLVLYYKELPQGYLPSDGIVPHFYWEGTIRVIPAELYV